MNRLLTGLLVVICFFPRLHAQSKDSLFFADDPVAAMLDSLARNSYITRIPVQQTQLHNKFHYAEDSVPACDPAIVKARLAKLDAQSPFDLVYNEDVQTYINLYTVHRRALVGRMLALSQLYYPMFEEQLDKYNLPLELKHLAVIESALNPQATSRAGARGLWQFMYTTAKMFNLNVTSYVDERCDPYKSTQAACELLQSLYSTFGDWQLALAAYNAGAGTVNKAIRRAGGGKKTYWEIRAFLPRETQAYVPAFIAANYVMSYHAEHNLFADAPRHVFTDIDTVSVKQEVNFSQLEAVLGIPVDELAFLNPMYKLGVIPLSTNGNPYMLVLPVSKVGNFITNEQAIYDYIKTDTAMQAMAIQVIEKTYIVKKGDHINTIAKRYKCSVTDLRAWNGLKSNYLRPGTKLSIYTPQNAPVQTAAQNSPQQQPAQQKTANTPKTQTAAQNNAAANSASSSASSSGQQYYTVQKGDNLWTIAKKTGKTVAELKKTNGFGDKFVMHAGDRIKL